MRLNLITLLLTGAILQVSATSVAQKISLSEKNTPLVTVFNKIRAQSGYDFLFTSLVLKDANQVTIRVKDMELEEILKKIFDHQPLEFRIENKSVIVSRKSEKIKSMSKSNLESVVPIDINGTIRDEKNLPLIGASVKVKGTNKATVTDAQGKFSIKAEKDDVLLISFIGYRSKEVAINGQNQLNIQLEESSSDLGELVVVGYGTTRKSNLTGAITSVSGSVLQNRPIPNIGQGLQGVVPNLTITNSSGNPNSTPSYNIRGFGSINGGSPLFVVDDVPLTSAAEINRLNAADVESITVLKDAASASIYGGRAAFGVIYIKTKKGKYNDGVNVQFSSNYAIKTLANRPDIITDPATVVKYKNLSYSSYYGFDLYPQEVVDYANKRSADMSLPPYLINSANPDLYWYVGNTNWYDELYKKSSPSWNNNLTVSGGADKIRYNITGGNMKQNGMFNGNSDQYNRYSLRGNIEFKATEWLKLSNTTQLGRDVYDTFTTWVDPPDSRGDLYHFIDRISSLTIPKNPNGTWTQSDKYGGGVGVAYLYDGGRSKSTTTDNRSTFEAQTSFLNNALRGTVNYTFQGTSNYYQDHYKPVVFQHANPNQSFQDGKSAIGNGASDTWNHLLNAYAEYEKTFAPDHYFKAMIGFSQENYHTERFSAYRTDLINAGTTNIGLASGVPSVNGPASEYAIRGAFYRLNYAYKEKYLLQINQRADATSRFPVNDRLVFLPSAQLGWRISEEKFFSSLKPAINEMKFRFSYGSLGNQNVSNYGYIPTLGSSPKIGDILGGAQPAAVYAPGLVSPSLTWEKQYTKNWGVDLNMLNNRFGASLDYYIRDVKDMLTAPKQQPAVLGTAPPLSNAADLRTKGWDLEATWNDKFKLAGSDFNYNLRVTLSDNQTVITKFDNPNGNLGSYYVGRKIGEIWGMETEGLFQSDAEVAQHANQMQVNGYYGFKAGDPKYRDLNGDNVINIGEYTLAKPGDLKIIGNNSPRYTYSFNAAFNWKGIDLSVFVQGVGKRDFWVGSTPYFWGQYTAPWDQVYQHVQDNMWSPENPNAYFPRFAGWRTGDFGDNSWKDLDVVQTRYLQNAAYMRLKNVTIGYTLSEHLVKRIGIKGLRFYLSGENLADLYNGVKFHALDPEALVDGAWGVGKVYPFQRTYSFGMNLNF